jgi:excisionase family DNA binding protein
LPTIKPAAMRLPVAAAYLGLSKSMLLKLAAQGRVQTATIGRARLFLTHSLDALLEERR